MFGIFHNFAKTLKQVWADFLKHFSWIFLSVVLFEIRGLLIFIESVSKISNSQFYHTQKQKP